MFRLANPDDTWRSRLDVAVPGDEAPQSHYVWWRVLDDDEINTLLAQSGQALLERAMANWEGVATFDGKELPFSPENLARLCQVPYWRRAAVDAYLRWIAGLPSKNSSTPPAAGGAAATGSSGSSAKTSIH